MENGHVLVGFGEGVRGVMARFAYFAACVAALIGMVVLATGRDASAQGRGAIACGTFYTVVRGDTLHAIASRVYPTPDYMAIYRANRSFMPSPAEIEIGDRLLIPCLDGSGFQAREDALAGLSGGGTPGASSAVPPSAPVTDGQGGGAMSLDPIARIVVLSEAAPYAGKRLPEGGMVTEIISRAMLRAPRPVDYEVVFDDAAVDPVAALAAGEFDLGFPVARPDCARATDLSDIQRRLCDGFVFSDVVATVETRFYVAAGNALASATNDAALGGKRLCRAAGRFSGTGPEVSGSDVVRERRTRDCFVQLSAGNVDVVSASGSALDALESQLGSGAAAVEATGLRRSHTIHVVAPRENARGKAFLVTLNQGLAEIRRSGEWATVVGNHLALEANAI